MDGLWTKRGIYYARVRLPDGTRRAMSLRTRSRDEAIGRRRELELLGDACWLAPTARMRSMAAAATAFLRSVPHACARPTVDMYRQKAASIVRILGERPVAAYQRAWAFELIDQRIADGVSRHTIAKELTALRGILHEAIALGWLRPRPIRALVPRFRSSYVPGSAAPTPAEAASLLQHLPRKRRSWVLLAMTGLRPAEIERLDKSMVDATSIRVPGTKIPRSRRCIPRPAFLAELDTEGAGPVVPPWSNVRRDLARACDRAGIPRYTPTDLRRAYASWLRAADVELDVIARLLGHAPGSAITSRVYAQVPPHELVEATQRLPALVDSPPPWPASTASVPEAPSTAGITTPTVSASRSARARPIVVRPPRSSEPPSAASS